MTLAEHCAKNAKLRRDSREAFMGFFQRPLEKYMDNLTGFDVVKFDEEIAKPNEGESTAAAVERQWGDEALALCRTLIGV